MNIWLIVILQTPLLLALAWLARGWWVATKPRRRKRTILIGALLLLASLLMPNRLSRTNSSSKGLTFQPRSIQIGPERVEASGIDVFAKSEFWGLGWPAPWVIFEKARWKASILKLHDPNVPGWTQIDPTFVEPLYVEFPSIPKPGEVRTTLEVTGFTWNILAVGFSTLLLLELFPAWRRRRLRVRRWRKGLCMACGYDLTGNISGRCPECGHCEVWEPYR